MTIQAITLHLSDVVVKRAKYAADALHRPLEEVLTEVLEAALPDVEDAAAELQADLTRLTWLDDRELWAIARQMMPDDQQQQLYALAELQAKRPLSPAEQEILETLRREYGRITLYKARAYALLSLRGGRPLLANN